MKNALLPYDGSESSERALRYLLQLPPEHRPEQIQLLNVQTWPLFHGQILTHDDVRIAREAQLVQARNLLRPAEDELLAAGVPFQSHILFGEPEHVIVEQVRQLGCDHIVMGTRGKGTIRSLLLGSVAMKTLHLTQVPVTLLK